MKLLFIVSILLIIILVAGCTEVINNDSSKFENGYILSNTNPDTKYEVYYVFNNKINVVRTDVINVSDGYVRLNFDRWEFTGNQNYIEWTLHKVPRYKDSLIIFATKIIQLKD